MSIQQGGEQLIGETKAPEQIDISMSGNRPTATPEEAKAYAAQTVFWRAMEDDRFWVVIFKGAVSPFQSGKLLFFGRGKGMQVGGPLRRDLKAGERFPYNLIYQDENGVPQVEDPIIMVRDIR